MFLEHETDPTEILDNMLRWSAAAAAGCDIERHERLLRGGFVRLDTLLSSGDVPLPDRWRKAATVADDADAALIGA